MGMLLSFFILLFVGQLWYIYVFEIFVCEYMFVLLDVILNLGFLIDLVYMFLLLFLGLQLFGKIRQYG